MKKLFLSVVLAFGLLAGMTSAQTLTYARSGLPVTLDSADSTDGNSLTVSYQITEPLLLFELGSTEVKPGLATEWSANEDSSVWTFKLREGVTFQDGTEFNAEAVKFNLDRWNDPENEYRFADEGKTYTAWGWVFGGPKGEGVLDSVEVIDDTTVQLNLTQPVGLLPNMIASSYFGLDSPTAVMEAGADYGTPSVGVVGTGPFKFEEWLEGERVVLSAYDNYWGGEVGFDQLVFRGIEDPTARLAELQAGTVDIAVDLGPDDLSVIESDPNLVRVPGPSLNVGYIAMNQTNEPLGDVRVRQAIAHAVDWQAIVDAFYGGLGIRATEFIPDAFDWARAGVEGYAYDPELARSLLAEAGFPDGFDTELWYMPVSRPYFPTPEPIASTVATYLADVGINAELMTEDWGIYLDDYQTGKFPMYMLGWSPDYGDPDNYLYTFFGPSAINDLGWDDPEVRDLLNEARQVTGNEARGDLYAQVTQAVYDDVASIPVAHNSVLYAARQRVQNWTPSPLGSTEQLYIINLEE